MQSRYCGVACKMTALKDRGYVWSGGYARSRNTARSVSFEANGRLLMGRKFVDGVSEFGFFSLGLTSGCFQREVDHSANNWKENIKKLNHKGSGHRIQATRLLTGFPDKAFDVFFDQGCR